MGMLSLGYWKQRLTNGKTEHICASGILAVAVVSIVLGAIALPIIVTWDGYGYLEIADAMAGAGPAALRLSGPPLYPWMVSVAMRLLGTSADSVMAVNLLFFIGTDLLLFAIARKMIGRWAAAIVVLVYSLSPVVIGYAHSVLLQSGMAFFCTAIVAAVVLGDDQEQHIPIRNGLFLAVALAGAYYMAANLYYLAVPAALILGSRGARPLGEKMSTIPSFSRLGTRLRLVLGVVSYAVAVVFISYAFTLPWRIAIEKTGDTRQAAYASGLILQAIPSPDSPEVKQFRKAYEKLITDAEGGGMFPLSGVIPNPGYYPVVNQFQAVNGMNWQNASYIFFRTALRSPGRYAAAFVRGFVFLLGVPSRADVNSAIVDSAFKPSKARGFFFPGPRDPTSRAIPARFEMNRTGSPVGPILWKLYTPYAILVMLGGISTLLLFFGAVARRDIDLLGLTVPALCTIGMYAVIGMSINRYEFAVQGLYFISAAMMVAYIARAVMACLEARRKAASGESEEGAG